MRLKKGQKISPEKSETDRRICIFARFVPKVSRLISSSRVEIPNSTRRERVRDTIKKNREIMQSTLLELRHFFPAWSFYAIPRKRGFFPNKIVGYAENRDAFMTTIYLARDLLTIVRWHFTVLHLKRAVLRRI